MSIIYEPKGRAREYAALAASLYIGCGHGCKYCYVPAVLYRTKEQFHNNPSPRKNILELFRNDCEKLPAGSKILFSFTTDTYQPINDTYNLTRQAIVIAHGCGIHVEILTKGGLRAIKDFDLLTSSDSFATTLTFLNPADSLEWELNAALPMDRLMSLKIAHDRHIKTWVSIEPVIDPEQSLELISLSAPFVDFFKIGKWNHDNLATGINWKIFVKRAINILKKCNKAFMIKEDLKKYL